MNNNNTQIYNSNEDDDILSNVFQNTSFINDRDSNFKKEDIQTTRLKQYKSINSNQHEKRIKYFLERQKEKRRSLISHVRTLISLPVEQHQQEQPEPHHEDDMLMDDEDTEITTVTTETTITSTTEEYNTTKTTTATASKKQKFKEISKRKHDHKCKQKDLLFSNHLMLAEGMIHIPLNLSSEWLIVPVPMGYRCLVVSQNDWTVVRSENGQVLNKFKSALPFGSEQSRESGTSPQNQYCILDCIYQDETNTFYILDILSWKGYILYDCETEFRFFWRDSKLQESNILNSSSGSGNGKGGNSTTSYKFQSIPYFCSTIESLEQIKCDKRQMLSFKTEFLLFYHKSSHYEFGSTPLFCSLSIEYIDMVIQVLNYRLKNGNEEEQQDEEYEESYNNEQQSYEQNNNDEDDD